MSIFTHKMIANFSATNPLSIVDHVCRPVGSNYRLGGGGGTHKKQLQIGGGGHT